MELEPLERAALEALLAGEGVQREILREQLATVRVVGREYTGVGMFTTLTVDPALPRCAAGLIFDRLDAEVEGLPHGAGFVLFTEDGRLHTLEAFDHDGEQWPERIGAFTLRPTRR